MYNTTCTNIQESIKLGTFCQKHCVSISHPIRIFYVLLLHAEWYRNWCFMLIAVHNSPINSQSPGQGCQAARNIMRQAIPKGYGSCIHGDLNWPLFSNNNKTGLLQILQWFTDNYGPVLFADLCTAIRVTSYSRQACNHKKKYAKLFTFHRTPFWLWFAVTANRETHFLHEYSWVCYTVVTVILLTALYASLRSWGSICHSMSMTQLELGSLTASVSKRFHLLKDAF